MNLAELANNDGQDGRRAYIAVNGTVYDVTDSPRWQNGLHPPDHKAGHDLTEELSKAPHVRTVVERFPVVGTLKEETPTQASSGGGKILIAIIVVVIVIALALLLVF